MRSRYSVRDWDVSDTDYIPPVFVHPDLIRYDVTTCAEGWADPATPDEAFLKTLKEKIATYTNVKIKFAPNGLPLNPTGRTGLTGRGLLSKYGPNFIADPIITRKRPDCEAYEMIVTRRDGGNVIGLPSGMVKHGDHLSDILLRAFVDEIAERPQVERDYVVDLFRSGGKVLYEGYVHDPRNTDVAWIETSCRHFHFDNDAIGANIKLKEGKHDQRLMWVPITDQLKLNELQRRLAFKAIGKKNVIKVPEAEEPTPQPEPPSNTDDDLVVVEHEIPSGEVRADQEEEKHPK
jgi:ADP-ribose pyrophosphatase